MSQMGPMWSYSFDG